MLADAGPDILEGLARRLIVCIDDVDLVAGNADWELALFSLFNDLQDQGNQLVVSAAAAPRECGFRLPDLESRLSKLPVFQVQPLDEQQRGSSPIG